MTVFSFKADDKKLQALMDSLGLDRSKAIRFAIDDAIERYAIPGYKKEIVVLNSEQFNSLIKSRQDRIHELEKEVNRYRGILDSLKNDDHLCGIIQDMEKSRDRLEANLKNWSEEQRKMRAELIRSQNEKE